MFLKAFGFFHDGLSGRLTFLFVVDIDEPLSGVDEIVKVTRVATTRQGERRWVRIQRGAVYIQNLQHMCSLSLQVGA